VRTPQLPPPQPEAPHLPLAAGREGMDREVLKQYLLEYQAGRLSYGQLQEKLASVGGVPEAYPLSEVQKGFWVMHQIAPAAYNVALGFRVRGNLDASLLREAADRLLTQHPILTNVILERNGVLLQVERPRPVELHEQSVVGMDPAALSRHLKSLSKLPFDLAQGPLVRWHLLCIGATEHVLLITLHHIVCDGASCQLLMKQLLENYRLLEQKRELPVPGGARYRDFVSWEREWLNDANAVARHEQYWMQQLAGPLPELRLPIDRARDAAAGFAGSTHVSQLDRECVERLKTFARSHKLKLPTVYLGLFKLLLHYCSGQNDVIVGMPVTTRSQERFRETLGCFINMIPVRSTVKPEEPFAAYLAQLQRTVATGLYHGSLPFARMVRLVEAGRNERYSPIFQAAFIYQERDAQLEVPTSLAWEPFGNLTQEGQYELTLEVLETADVPLQYWKYDPELLEASTIERMAGMFAGLARLVIHDDAPVAECLTREQRDWSAEWIRKAQQGAADGAGAAGEERASPGTAEAVELGEAAGAAEAGGASLAEASTSNEVSEAGEASEATARGARAEPGAHPERSAHPEPATAPEPAASARDLVREVTSLWEEVLHVKDVDPDRGFFQSGGNSVTSVLLAERIARTFGCPFTITLLFRHSSVNKIVEYLRRQLNLVEPASRSSATSAGTKTAAATNATAASSGAANARSTHATAGSAVASATAASPGAASTRTAHETAEVATAPRSGATQARGAARAAEATRPTAPVASDDDTTLAIIGISCELPGARNYREYWNNLVNGVESSQVLSAKQLRARGVPDELLNDENYVPVVSSMIGKDEFDAQFFNVPDATAAMMDPQLRLLLQNSWHAVEDAGYLPADIPDTSVVMTANNAGYHASLNGSPGASGTGPLADYLMAQGGTIATSVSYYLGFTGPSLFVHTNCSSSLTALHTASQHLRLKESKYALVGAASIYSRDRIGYIHQPGSLLSREGHCRAFDAAADGMTSGEGAAAVLIKRTRDAIEDGDHIYAIIRAIGLNNDGTDKAGFNAPSVGGQSALIGKVLAASGVSARSIDYVETSATGSRLGDPIEVMALESAYRAHTDEKQFCAIGSVKPNIGHLDSAAGLAGLIKVALCLYHGEVPPSINFSVPNPEIDFGNSPFFVATTRLRLPVRKEPNRAALSSFGIGGTNVHAILERHVPAREPASVPNGGRGDLQLVPVSAKTREGLQRYVTSLLDFLERYPDCSLPALAYTFQTGRMAFAHRMAFVAGSTRELFDALQSFLRAPERQAVRPEQVDASTLRECVRTRQLLKLACAWVGGADVPWHELHRGSPPLRGSFPTYPFARQRYWLSDLPALLDDASADFAVASGAPHATHAARSSRTSRGSTAKARGTGALPARAGHAALTGIDKVRGYLRECIASVQGGDVEDVDVSLGFFEMGLSSYELLKVVGQLEHALGARISPLAPLQYPTFSQLAQYLHRNFGERFEALRVDTPVLAEYEDEPRAVASGKKVVERAEPRPAARAPVHRHDDEEPDIVREFRSGHVSIESMLALLKEDALSQDT
jgi:3-oxoacyl-(acyl-carrier-protein) synthase/acyl carrier protein